MFIIAAFTTEYSTRVADIRALSKPILIWLIYVQDVILWKLHVANFVVAAESNKKLVA